ncbi:MAG: hypothetical protein IIA89_06195 [Chloroflexi bacterium]|nr:hypothetical protein [Chloroflexota bacterium]
MSFIEGLEEREADNPLSPEEDRMALDCIADVWSGYLSEASEALGCAPEVFKKVPGEPPAMAKIRHMGLTARGLINKSTTIQRGIVAVMRRELE